MDINKNNNKEEENNIIKEKQPKNEHVRKLGPAAMELLKPENLIGPFDTVEDLMKSLWDDE